MAVYRHWIIILDAFTGAQQAWNWERLPLVAFCCNKQEIPLIWRVKSLQDGVDVLSLQDAKRFLNTSELEEFKWTVEEYIQQAEQLGLSDEIKKKLENASARYHIRRLEAIQLQVEQRLAAATAKAEDTMLQELTSTVEEISSRTMYEVQKGLNVGFNVSQIDEKTVQQLLNTGWSTDGKTFSSRLWENQQKLVSTLEQQQAIIQGKSLSQVVQQLTKTMESSRFNIARVVYTESAHAIETGKIAAYEELGVDELEIIATLDARTCAVCGDLDGKTVRRTDAVSGVSIPPWHPRCRCTTAPAVDEKYGERIARDENGETYTVPADTTYEQWKEQQKAEAVDAAAAPAPASEADYSVRKAKHSFSDGAGGTLTERNAIIYEASDGTQFIFPEGMDQSIQTMAPQLAIDAWNKVPEYIRNKAQKIVEFVDYENPQDSYWRATYKNFDRSYATGGNEITFYRYEYQHNADYVTRTYCHEIGHYIDRAASSLTEYSSGSFWTNAMKNDKISSGLTSMTSYGENSNAEDFAESIAEYAEDPALFEKTMPERAKLLKQLLNGP